MVKLVRVTLAVMTVLGCVAAAQGPASDDPFRAIAALIGQWEGRSAGEAGAGTVRREYARAVDMPFVRVQNTSTYEPQPKNPKGEVHRDEGFFSYDKSRKRLILRQFHKEGFVNQYGQEPSTGSAPLVFTSESIENIPAGWRARETYVMLGPDAFEETFELAPPDKDFALYTRTRFTRVRP